MEDLLSSPRYFQIFLKIFLIISQISPILTTQPSNTIEFIKTSCQETSYPKLCYNSLSTYANAIQTSPKSLAHAALTVTLTTAKTTSAAFSRMKKSPGMRPREVGAMKDCLEVLGDSVEELQNSINKMSKMKGNKFGLIMNDIQTWVSAALTDENTCADGFGGKAMNGKVKMAVRAKIVNICHLTSNALALVNKYASSMNA